MRDLGHDGRRQDYGGGGIGLTEDDCRLRQSQDDGLGAAPTIGACDRVPETALNHAARKPRPQPTASASRLAFAMDGVRAPHDPATLLMVHRDGMGLDRADVRAQDFARQLGRPDMSGSPGMRSIIIDQSIQGR